MCFKWHRLFSTLLDCGLSHLAFQIDWEVFEGVMFSTVFKSLNRAAVELSIKNIDFSTSATQVLCQDYRQAI